MLIPSLRVIQRWWETEGISNGGEEGDRSTGEARRGFGSGVDFVGEGRGAIADGVELGLLFAPASSEAGEDEGGEENETENATDDGRSDDGGDLSRRFAAVVAAR